MFGDEVDTGDEHTGIVVVSVDEGLYGEDYPYDSWAVLKTGILVESSQGGLMHFKEPDVDLVLIRRGDEKVQALAAKMDRHFYDGQVMPIRLHNKDYIGPMMYDDHQIVSLGDEVRDKFRGLGVVISVNEVIYGPAYPIEEWRGMKGVFVVFENGELAHYDEPDEDLVLVGRNHPDCDRLKLYFQRLHGLVSFSPTSRDIVAGRLEYQDQQPIQIGDEIERGDGASGVVVCIMATGESTEDYPIDKWSKLAEGFLLKTEQGLLIPYDAPSGDMRLIRRNGAN